jgi:hypothetical protein
VWQIPDAVDTVVCAPDDGWRYHPKHVEQFPDIIKCVTLHLGYILEYLEQYFLKIYSFLNNLSEDGLEEPKYITGVTK